MKKYNILKRFIMKQFIPIFPNLKINISLTSKLGIIYPLFFEESRADEICLHLLQRLLLHGMSFRKYSNNNYLYYALRPSLQSFYSFVFCSYIFLLFLALQLNEFDRLTMI